MKHLITSIVLTSSCLFAAETQNEPYDADLFWKNTRTVFVNIEPLYWTVDESSLDYAIKMEKPAPTSASTVYASGKFKKGTFNWDPGIRASVGWFNAPHFWDIYCQYTYFRADGHDKVTASTNPSLFLNGTWPQPNTSTATPLSSAHSHLDFVYNLLDAVCTRRYHPNPHLRVKLSGGASMGWFRNDWRINYTDTSNNTSVIRNGWRYTGAGLNVGLAFDWYWDFCDLYLYGAATGRILAGFYHNHSKQSTSLAQPGYIRNAHFHDTRLTFSPRIVAGPAWEKRFDAFRIEIFAGYELTVWTNLHEVFRSTGGAVQASKETQINTGGVAIQGLTTRLTLDF